MRRFSKRLDIPENDSHVSRTLMINHIPKVRCNKADLLRHFKYYKKISLQNSMFIHLVYFQWSISRVWSHWHSVCLRLIRPHWTRQKKVCNCSVNASNSRVIKIFNSRQFSLQARNFSVSEAMNGNQMLVHPFVCGNLCVCCDPCCSRSKVDAAEFYTTEERRLATKVEAEKLKVFILKSALR